MIAEAAAGLEKLIAASPLEPIPAEVRANARQRAEAANRLGLWLVARVCRKNAATREAGDRLAAEALAAARRQSDPIWTLAMLRESCQQALVRGDRATAESLLGSPLDAVLDLPSAPSDVRRPAAPQARDRVPVLPIERFRQAAGLARLAAEDEMGDLSLRAVRRSLRGGPPALPLTVSTTAVARVVARASPDAAPSDPAAREVETALVELDALWQRNKASPSAMYETLRDIALPAARPSEIFLYRSSAGGADSSDASRPGVAQLLVRAAVTAAQADDLRKRLAERQTEPAASCVGQTLLNLLVEAEKKG